MRTLPLLTLVAASLALSACMMDRRNDGSFARYDERHERDTYYHDDDRFHDNNPYEYNGYYQSEPRGDADNRRDYDRRDRVCTVGERKKGRC